jgi:hypothetical protein
MNMDQRRAEINRRSLLCAFPVVIGAGAATAASAITVETPVMRKFREWEEHTEWLNGPGGLLEGDEWEAAVERQTDLEDDLLDIPSENVRDVIAKVAAYSNFGQNGLPTREALLWSEMREFIGQKRSKVTGAEFAAKVERLPQEERGMMIGFLRNLAGGVV